MDGVVTSLVAAVQAIHDPASGLQHRQAAQKYIDDFKQNDGAVFEYGLALTRLELDDHIRHFGLSLLEHLVKHRWNAFSPEQKSKMKEVVLQLMASGTKETLIEKTFIKEKVSELVVEVAKREWPQRWPDMIDYLMKISQMGCELVLLVLRGLPDDVKVYNSDLSDQRKRDIQTAMNAALPGLFAFFYQLLASKYSVYIEASDPLSDERKRSHKLLTAVLLTLSSFVEWAPMQFIVEFDFFRVFCDLLCDLDLRIPSCECLLLILSRKFRPEERARLLALFDHLDSMVSSLSKSKNNAEEDYQYHKRLGQFITMLGTHQLAGFRSTATKSLPPTYETFLKLVLTLTGHPSLLLTSFALPFWLLLLHEEPISKQQSFLPFINELLKICSVKLMKVHDLQHPDSATAAFTSLDFDTREGFLHFFAVLRGKVLELIKANTAVQPEVSMNYCLELLKNVLSMQPGPQDLGPNGCCTVHSPVYLWLESGICFLESVLQGLPKNVFALSYPPQTPEQDAVSQRFATLCETALQMLFSYDTKDPLMMTRQLSGIKAFTRYYAYRPASLEAVTSKLLSLLSFGEQQVRSNPTAAVIDIVTARRKACTCMIHICHELPGALLPLLPRLAEVIGEAEQAGHVFASEKTLLTEALVEVSNGMRNYERQAAFLGTLVGRTVAQWTSPEVSALFKDAQSLLHFLGLATAPAATPLPIFSDADARRRVYSLVQTLSVVAKRSAAPTEPAQLAEGGFVPAVVNGVSFPYRHPFSPQVPAILPNLVTLLRTVHSLWEPAVRALVPPEWASLYAVDEGVAATLLGEDRSGKWDLVAPNSPQAQVKHTRSWLENARDMAYRLLQALTGSGESLYTIRELPQILRTYVFTSLDHMENRHWRVLLHVFVTSFVRHCPVPLIAPVLEPTLPGVLVPLFNRLTADWAALGQRSAAPATPNDKERTEVVEDIILRELTREYFDFLKVLFKIENSPLPHPDVNVTDDVDVKHSATELSAFLLSTEAITTPLLYSVLSGMTWPDSVAIRRACEIASRIVNLVSDDPKFHKIIGQDMLAVALRALANNQGEEFFLLLIALIRDIYWSLHTKCAYPQQLFLSLPNVTPQILQELNASLAKFGSPRRQRQFFKTLFIDTIGVSILAQRKTTILDLPEKLFVAKMTAPSWADTTASLDLGGLFKKD